MTWGWSLERGLSDLRVEDRGECIEQGGARTAINSCIIYVKVLVWKQVQQP